MTAQAPDILIFEDAEYALLGTPLEDYYEQFPPRPAFISVTSRNWRGYTARWEVTEDMLYLVDIGGHIGWDFQSDYAYSGAGMINLLRPRGRVFPYHECTFEELFPKNSGKIAATWFSGTLRLGCGWVLHYVHAGYASVWVKEVFLRIEEGRLVGIKRVNNLMPWRIAGRFLWRSVIRPALEFLCDRFSKFEQTLERTVKLLTERFP